MLVAQTGRELEREKGPIAQSERRIALIIGNGTYTNAPSLKNPPNDARDMAATLRTLGFDVTSAINANQRDMKRLIREFGQKLKAGGAGLFYYAGHGVQSKGHNYLIPVDADIQSEAEVEDTGVDVGLVLNFMDDAQNGLNIVILDACRNNPFVGSFRSSAGGLAQIDAPTGTLIAYATAPGRVASDGTGQNGIYTAELLKQMQVPGLGATEMFMRVRAEVIKQTVRKQVPWEASSLVGAFYFSPPAKAIVGSPPNAVNETKGDRAAVELQHWELIRNSTNQQDYRDYLTGYPNGVYAGIAKTKLRQIEEARDARDKNVDNLDVKKPNSTTGSTPTTLPHVQSDLTVTPKEGAGSLTPQLVYTRQKSYEANGENWVRYYLSVTNRSVYRDEMFASAPKLPPCGVNTKSSRTWVDVYDKADKRLNGFCGVLTADGLGDLWFTLPEGDAPPSQVFVIITDRQSKAEYKSNLVAIPYAGSIRPGTLTSNLLNMKFAYIPAGSFQMGGTQNDSEKPIHTVTISRGFYIGTTEVTQAQWVAVMWNNPSSFTNCDACPVENVSWEDVQVFIKKLNDRGDGKYRLPTEAEWEYAARAGSITEYSSGDGEGVLDRYAWYDANSGSRTHEVATKQPNAWGLFDMHGNVWEWVQDLYGDYPNGNTSDPSGVSSGSDRSLRGGSWGVGAGSLRSANRSAYKPAFRDQFLGFRVVRY